MMILEKVHDLLHELLSLVGLDVLCLISPTALIIAAGVDAWRFCRGAASPICSSVDTFSSSDSPTILYREPLPSFNTSRGTAFY